MASARRPPGRPRVTDDTVPTAEQILRAAGELFMRLGYRTVTMDMVAEAAGITKAAVYYHFSDKAALVCEAVVSVFDNVARYTARYLELPSPLYDRLVAIAEVVLNLPDPFMSFETLVREAQPDLSAGQLRRIREAESRVGDLVVAAMQAGVRGGDLRGDLDATLFAHAYLALMPLGQSRAPSGTHRFPDRTYTARTLVDMFWHGVSAPGEMPANKGGTSHG